MFRISEPVASSDRSSAPRVLLLLLAVAVVVNTAAAALSFHDDALFRRWLTSPAPAPMSEIIAMERDVAWRASSRLAISAVLVLSALAFVWQRRRHLSTRGELHQVQQLAYQVLESMVQGVIAVDGDGLIREVNPAAARLLGGDPPYVKALVDRPLDALPVGGAELRELVREASSHHEPIWDRDLTVERDGLTLRLRADAQAVRTPDGRVGYILLLRDLTRLLLVEERMRRMERISGLGDAATGLVHEIKNPLTALSIHIQLLDETLVEARATGEVAELIGVLKSEADRLNNVLDGFWDYAHVEGLSVQRTDPVAILERVAQLIRPQAERQGVRVALRRPPDPVPAMALDPEKVHQAVWNLATNALESMPAGGELAIEAVERLGAFSVIVRDTGPGIPAEIRGDILKPYFSTKSHGTGLGLALAEKVVGLHNGGIAFRTGPEGTAFELTFPRARHDGARADHADRRRLLPHSDLG